MDKKDFYYELPPELIAQQPLKDRASSFGAKQKHW